MSGNPLSKARGQNFGYGVPAEDEMYPVIH